MKNTKIYKGEVPDLILPDHVADWDVHEYWEREVYDSMQAHMGPDDCLLVAGAEHGYMAALWSRLCGSTVLVEPWDDFWRNIRLTWEANGLKMPLANMRSFLSDDTTDTFSAFLFKEDWPECAYPDEEAPARVYRYLFEAGDVAVTPSTTIDNLIFDEGLPITAISIDTEGGEVRIIPGARRALEEGKLKYCWISMHPELIERDYPGFRAKDVHHLFNDYGYSGKKISVDHEEHWLFKR